MPIVRIARPNSDEGCDIARQNSAIICLRLSCWAQDNKIENMHQRNEAFHHEAAVLKHAGGFHASLFRNAEHIWKLVSLVGVGAL